MGIKKMYNQEGQVNDKEIARTMANIEKPFREKRIFGIFKNKGAIATGENLAKEIGERDFKLQEAKKFLQEAKEKLNMRDFEDAKNAFKENFPEFSSFLKNNDFSFLVTRGVSPSIIEKDEKLDELLEIRPYRKEYGAQFAYCGADGGGALIVYNNKEGKIKSEAVKQDYYMYMDHAGRLYDEEIDEKNGETVKEALQRLGLENNNYAVIVFNDSSYSRGSLVEKNRTGSPLQENEIPKKNTQIFIIRNEEKK